MINKEGKLAIIDGSEKILVVGDLHGDYEAYLKTKEFLSKDYLVIYLGDYVDRGDFGFEILEDLIETCKKYSTKVLALKGNHESFNEWGEPNFHPCDLIDEVLLKNGDWKSYFLSKLKPFFDSLPLCAISYNLNIFFVHGGISSRIKTLDNLKYPNKEIEEDLLWSDPFDGYGEYFNPRGAGVLFGKDITENFCSNFAIEKIIRSHEPRKAIYSPAYEHDNRVITISSTRVYGGRPHALKIDKGIFEVIYLV